MGGGLLAGYELESGMRWSGNWIKRPHKVVMVYPLAFPPNGDLEALIEASWEKET